MNRFLPLLGICMLLLHASCSYLDKFIELEDGEIHAKIEEDASDFTEIGSLVLSGGEGAAEISAFDPASQKLFVVNNAGTSRIDVVDLANPALPRLIGSLDISAYGAGVNSVAVKDGMLAAAVEAQPKQQAGQVLVFDTRTQGLMVQRQVGALPDMVTFSPDGAYILTANEGEPSSDYRVDPAGSISVIAVKEGFQVHTLDFNGFDVRRRALEARGLRVFGPYASLAQDLEPEYITVSDNSELAWVSLQENNAIATVDLRRKMITDIQPLGFKDFSSSLNAFDASDKDGGVQFNAWPVKGIYMPDALASFSIKGSTYILSANEGDAREYSALEEEVRVKDLVLDSRRFPDAARLQQDQHLGRLKVTKTLGQGRNSNVFQELFAFGARSFSIWHARSGRQVWDSGNELEQQLLAAGLYPDDRSDDKGAEPEGIALGRIGRQLIAFVGCERADAVLTFDVSNPQQPQFLQVFSTGDAPEGLLFIPAAESPTRRSLLVVSSEGDGVVKIFQAGMLAM